MYRYTLEFYHNVVRKPMLEFKKKVLSQVCKRQDQGFIINKIDNEIAAKKASYLKESQIEFGPTGSKSDICGTDL